MGRPLWNDIVYIDSLYPDECILNNILAFAERPKNSVSAAGFSLHVSLEHPTARVIHLLIELMNVKLPLGVNGEKCKWRYVILENFSILHHSTAGEIPLENNYVAPDAVSSLGTTLTSRVTFLKILDSPGVMDCLLQVPCWDMNKLYIRHENGIHTSVCATLGTIFQQSMNLKHLELERTPLESLRLLMDGLGGALHLEYLHLGDILWPDSTPRQRQDDLAALIEGVSHLLQNPKSQLRRLELISVGLRDEHLMAITPLLCATLRRTDQDDDEPATTRSKRCYSRLEVLNVSHNEIDSRSILDFAHRLPDMPCLRIVDLQRNDWDDGAEAKTCMEALWQGVLRNYSLESLYPFVVEGHQQEIRLCRQFRWNHCGRRIFSTSDPVPLGLWARIFERAGNIMYKDPSDHYYPCESVKEEGFASAIYFLLMNSPYFLDKINADRIRDQGSLEAVNSSVFRQVKSSDPL